MYCQSKFQQVILFTSAKLILNFVGEVNNPKELTKYWRRKLED